LQLCPQTFIIVDETKLSEGKVLEQGLKNLRALNKVASSSLLEYQFGEYAPVSEFPVDTPVFVVSERPSLLYHDLVCPVHPVSASDSDANDMDANSDPSADDLDCWRNYLMLARNCEFEFDSVGSQILEKGFAVICAQQSNRSQMFEKQMHLRATFARLYCMSHAQQTMSEDLWKQGMSLMDKCMQRTQS
jgi:hypothetical protein